MCNLNAMDTDKPFSFGSQVWARWTSSSSHLHLTATTHPKIIDQFEF